LIFKTEELTGREIGHTLKAPKRVSKFSSFVDLPRKLSTLSLDNPSPTSSTLSTSNNSSISPKSTSSGKREYFLNRLQSSTSGVVLSGTNAIQTLKTEMQQSSDSIRRRLKKEEVNEKEERWDHLLMEEDFNEEISDKSNTEGTRNSLLTPISDANDWAKRIGQSFERKFGQSNNMSEKISEKKSDILSELELPPNLNSSSSITSHEPDNIIDFQIESNSSTKSSTTFENTITNPINTTEQDANHLVPTPTPLSSSYFFSPSPTLSPHNSPRKSPLPMRLESTERTIQNESQSEGQLSPRRRPSLSSFISPSPNLTQPFTSLMSNAASSLSNTTTSTFSNLPPLSFGRRQTTTATFPSPNSKSQPNTIKPQESHEREGYFNSTTNSSDSSRSSLSSDLKEKISSEKVREIFSGDKIKDKLSGSGLKIKGKINQFKNWRDEKKDK
jgi:hypothetical protein